MNAVASVRPQKNTLAKNCYFWSSPTSLKTLALGINQMNVQQLKGYGVSDLKLISAQ